MPVQVGDIIEGKVTDIMNYGVFIKLNDGKSRTSSYFGSI